MYLSKKSQNEITKNISVWEGNPEALVRTVNSLGEIDKFPLLKGIDLYEDTYFNSIQTKELVKELEKIKNVLLEKKSMEEIDSLVSFAENIKLGESLYFSGD